MSVPAPGKIGWFERACRHHAVGRAAGALLVLVPFAALIGFAIPFGSPETRPLARTLLSEGNVVEWIGFLGFLFGGIMGFRLSSRLRKLTEPVSVSRFYLVLAIVLVVLAGEEISWGQKVLGFTAPEFLQSINQQKETNVHNLPIIQELNEWFLIVVGLVGFAASTFWFHAKRWKFGTPPLVGHWFLLIALMEIVDISPLHHLLTDEADYALAYLIEVSEMLLGIACLLWVTMNGRILKGGAAARS